MIHDKYHTFWIFLAVIFLTGCSPVTLPAATTIPTQDIWKITYSSELTWLVDDFDACLDDNWGSDLVVEETQSLDPRNSPSDILLVWGSIDPQGWDAYQLGMDGLLAAVNPQLALAKISASDLEAIINGSVQDWAQIDGDLTGEIHVWIYPDHTAIWQALETKMGGLGKIASSAWIAPDVPAMLDAIAADPLAIGLVPKMWPQNGVKAIDITDWVGADVPVVALSKVKIDDYTAAWLACLSGKLRDE